MVQRFGYSKDTVICGGIAKKQYVYGFLQNYLKIDFLSYDLDPQLVNRLGAALHAKELE